MKALKLYRMRNDIKLIVSVPDQHIYYYLIGTFSAFFIIIQHKVFVLVVHIPELAFNLHKLVPVNASLGGLGITERPEVLPLVLVNIYLLSCAPDYTHIR